MGLMVDLITRKMVVSMDLPGLVNGGFMVILHGDSTIKRFWKMVI